MTTGNANIPPSKITVKIKASDATLKEDFLIYDAYTMSYDDIVLNEIINMTLAHYRGSLEDCEITVTSRVTWAKDLKDKEE